MIQEAYVSYEVAKLLKEKGFNEGCRYYYPDSHTQLISYMDCKQSDMFGPEACIAPTQSMAMKWLREVHNLWCEISPEGKGLWYREVYSLTDEEYIPNSNGHKIKSYEEAVEAALKYSLENLVA